MTSTENCRYEYRIFGSDLRVLARGLADRAERALTTTSRETYLVSATTTSVGTKIRDGRLEIKELFGHHDAFEQWCPAEEMLLPVSREGVAHVMARLAAIPPPLPSSPIDADTLYQLTADARGIKPAHLTKQRVIYELPDDVWAEHTYVVCAGHRLETVAVESKSIRALTSVASDMALHKQPNISYPARLQRLLFPHDATIAQEQPL